MKTHKSSRIVNIVKSVFNVRAWIDYDRIKTFLLYLVSVVKKLFYPPTHSTSSTAAKKSFTAAIQAQNLTENELLDHKKSLYRLSLIMCVLAISIFSYAIYHLIYSNFKATIVSLVVTLIALALAFRYHFWYFQIKTRQLGCTFKDWWNDMVRW